MIVNVFCHQLQTANWQNFFQIAEVNDMWLFMKNVILHSINGMCPIKDFKVSNVKDPRISNELPEMIKDKDRALKKAKRPSRETDWTNARRLKKCYKLGN